VTRPWAASNSYAWAPTVGNLDYKVLVQVRSAWNSGAAEFSLAKPFAIQSGVTAATLTPGVAAPQFVNSPVTWTASASGGIAPYQYQFSVFDGTAYTVTRSWAAGNSWTWTPAVANANYKVVVQVRSASSTGASEFSIAVPFAIRAGVSAATLTPNLAAPQNAGATVTWTASASGGIAPYQYQFSVYDGATYSVTRPWATGNTFAWTPGAGNLNYKVVVQVRSAPGAGASEFSVAVPFAIRAVTTAVVVTPSVAAPVGVGKAVSFTAQAIGGQAPYQYQWSVFNGGWTIVSAWSTSGTLSWTPAVANSANQVRVEARSAWNTGAAERSAAVTYPVMASVTGATITPNLASPRATGTTIRWQASVSGGQAPYQYQFAVFDGTAWVNLTGYTSSSSYDWTPTRPGTNYKMAVRVRSAWNNGAEEFTAFSGTYVVTGSAIAAIAAFTPALPSQGVDHYVFEVFAPTADPDTAVPIAVQNIGLPPIVLGECNANVLASILALPPGNYVATVSAVIGQTRLRSEPASFTR
jgi:hypothetical protein